MRCRLAVSILLVSSLSSVASAAAPQHSGGGNAAAPRSDVASVIDRGLAFLIKDARAWKTEHNCVSCHHASLVLWSLREAGRSGRPVDAAMAAELTKWIADSGDGKTSVKRPPQAAQALNAKAVHFALALETNAATDDVSQKGLKRLLKTVENDQVGNRSWMAWPETRPPIFGSSDETMTALATLALLPAAAAGDRAAAVARDKGVDWLAKTKSDDDPQSVALRLVLWRRLGRPAQEWHPLLARIRNSQQADGGWSQAKEMASDAWATGQALYALSHADVGPNDSAVARAHVFLSTTQRSDGSWPMTSRPVKPGGRGSSSLIPITGAGTAWAVIGLARSSRTTPAGPAATRHEHVAPALSAE